MVLHDVSSHRPGDRFEVWREVICREFTPLIPDPVPVAGGSFTASVEVRPLGGTNRAVLASVPQRIAHGPSEVARTDEGVYFVNMQLAGTCRMRTEAAGEVEVVPGQLAVVDTTRPYWFDYDGPWRVMSFQVPHDALVQVDASAPRTIGLPIDSCTGIGLAVSSVMKALWEHDAGASAASDPGRHLERAFYSTVEAALAGSWKSASESASSVRSAATAYIRSHSDDPSLSVSAVAHALSVSSRTVHYAFEGGDSFAAVVREERLSVIAAALRDPADSRSISRIAMQHGMVDASSFSRAFRRQYSMSARDYRAHARTATRESAVQR